MRSKCVELIDWRWRKRGRFKAVWDAIENRGWVEVTCPSWADAVRLQRSASYRRIKHDKLETWRRGCTVFIRKSVG